MAKIDAGPDVALPPIGLVPFRQTMQSLAGAVSVLSVGEGDRRTGLTSTSVTSFSADPPTIAISVNTGSSSWSAITSFEAFCINVLAKEQRQVAESFAGKGGLAGPARYANAEWTVLDSGAPVLEGALANIDCVLDEAIVRHSHALVIGRIVAVRTLAGGRPLLYWRRHYQGLEDALPAAE